MAFSPNPNIFTNPAIQLANMPNWLVAGTYNFGDCVKGSDGMAYCLLAATSGAPGYPVIGLTSNPTFPGKSLSLKNQNGIDYGGAFTNTTAPGTAPAPLNPDGAQWVNLSLLSPVATPWNPSTLYKLGDLVYYPDPTVVWRCNAVTSEYIEPNVPGRRLNLLPGDQPGANNFWGLISNPVQTTGFNPQIPYISGKEGNGAETLQPLPVSSVRPTPL